MVIHQGTARIREYKDLTPLLVQLSLSGSEDGMMQIRCSSLVDEALATCEAAEHATVEEIQGILAKEFPQTDLEVKFILPDGTLLCDSEPTSAFLLRCA